jgi:hypothetical protein
MALASTVSPRSMPLALMSAKAKSLVVSNPLTSAAAQMAQGSPPLKQAVAINVSAHILGTNRRLEYADRGSDVRQVGSSLCYPLLIHADRGGDFPAVKRFSL